MRLVPHLSQLHTKFGKKGLVIIASERQGHSVAEINAKLGPMGATYPVVAGQAGAYSGGTGIPHGWIVGVDGMVIWEGNPSGGIDKIIEDELAKIKYPGLGQLDVAKGLEKSATRFVDNKMDDSRKEAQKAIEKATKKAIGEDGVVDETKLGDDEKAVVKDANFILGRIAERAESLKAKATTAMEAKEYKKAHDAWSALEGQFGKDAEGVEGKAKAKELTSDKDIKKEIKATEKFLELIEGASFKNGSDKKKNGALKGFARSYKGTKAAEEAEAMMTGDE